MPGNIEVFKRLKEQITIPLATGERDRTIWEIIPYLQKRCIDILQPDCCHTGGITPMKKIATLAEAYHVPLAPHCTASFLGIAASLHVAASIPFFLIHEFYPDNAGFNAPGITRMALEARQGRLHRPADPSTRHARALSGRGLCRAARDGHLSRPRLHRHAGADHHGRPGLEQGPDELGLQRVRPGLRGV